MAPIVGLVIFVGTNFSGLEGKKKFRYHDAPKILRRSLSRLRGDAMTGENVRFSGCGYAGGKLDLSPSPVQDSTFPARSPFVRRNRSTMARVLCTHLPTTLLLSSYSGMGFRIYNAICMYVYVYIYSQIQVPLICVCS